MEIATAANALGKLRKANPRLIILTFKDHVRNPYGAQIEEGNLEFFLEKDYTSDVEGSTQAGAILDKVDKIKEPIRNMDETEKARFCSICRIL